MLVTISDLHLTDGSSGATISAGAFRIFASRLRDLAVAASYRADGSYRPVERIDLVLLGDVLDLIRSRQWNDRPGVRPWGNPQEPEFVETVTRITSDILRHNYEALQVLRGLSETGGVTVQPADRSGRPVVDAAGLPVPVQIHYMVGNHDWFYHLSGPSYDILRQALVRHMGLANRPHEPFPHDPVESDELLAIMRRHKLLARHGDLFDPFNFEGDRNGSSLGDAMVIELLNRFALEVETRLSDELPAATLAGLRELDNVRPLMLIPVWIDGLLERTCSLPAQRKLVKRVWDDLADQFLAIPFVRARDTWRPGELVDGMERLLRFSRRLSIDWASAIMNWLNQLRAATPQSFYRHALAEQDFRNRRARHIVYGHTHHAETVPLDASYADTYVLNQVYFNSGTWRRVHRQTQLAADEHEFIATEVMTYLTFFQNDERGGRPYETWSGTLALPPSETPIYRVDRPLIQPAGTSSTIMRTPPIHGPHFSNSTLVTPDRSADTIS